MPASTETADPYAVDGGSVRRRVPSTLAVLVAAGAATASLILAAPAVAGTQLAAKPPANLIKNPGAEQAKPNAAGGKVAVRHWKPGKGTKFTAVAYGTAGGFPVKKSPGPAGRGRNFFSGGTSGNASSATQTISLANFTKLIGARKAKFRLSAYLGGFATQHDRATLTVTWKSAKGKVLGHTTIGPVTEAQRKGVTGLLARAATGKVPAAARTAVVTLRMVRQEGTYVDGYADNLVLAISK